MAISTARERGHYGILLRHYGPDDPRTVAARHELTEARLRQAVDRILADAPPLSDEAADRLAALLRGEAS